MHFAHTHLPWSMLVTKQSISDYPLVTQLGAPSLFSKLIQLWGSKIRFESRGNWYFWVFYLRILYKGWAKLDANKTQWGKIETWCDSKELKLVARGNVHTRKQEIKREKLGIFKVPQEQVFWVVWDPCLPPEGCQLPKGAAECKHVVRKVSDWSLLLGDYVFRTQGMVQS